MGRNEQVNINIPRNDEHVVNMGFYSSIGYES